jgi:hypothetical protein
MNFRDPIERQYLSIRNHPESLHRWLCHPGEPCQDGCDTPADGKRLAVMDRVENALWRLENDQEIDHAETNEKAYV